MPVQHNLDHLIVSRAEQQRRHKDFMARSNPPQQPREPQPAVLEKSDADRYRWMRAQYLARTAAGKEWESRGRLVRRLGAAAFEVDEMALISPAKPKAVCDARQKIIAFASIVCGSSSTRIGEIFRRDHSTVLHAIAKYRSAVVSSFADEANPVSIGDVSIGPAERLSQRLIEDIRRLLRDRPLAVQRDVLFELVADWLSRMQPDSRAEAINLWIEALRTADGRLVNDAVIV
jgi:Bacterial dnaA protein helix-turn-helix